VRRLGAIRSVLAAALLLAVGAASAVEGAGADFVGGDDGDAPVVCRQRENAVVALDSPRAPDVFGGALRRAPFLAVLGSPSAASVEPGSPAAGVSSSERDSLFTLPAPVPRAPPSV